MGDVDRIDIYRFCPRCGAEAVTVVTPQLVICDACGLQLYYNPGSAAAAIVLDARDRVLLVRREHAPAAGMLAFPGGFIDTGESVEQGLRRELMEEVGLEVDDLEYVTSHPNFYPYAEVVYPTLDFFFWTRVESFGKAAALDGVSGLDISPISEVRPEDLAFESMRIAWLVFLRKWATGLKRS